MSSDRARVMAEVSQKIARTLLQSRAPCSLLKEKVIVSDPGPGVPAQVRRVFVSYAKRDRLRARKVIQLLETQGFKVWWDERLIGGTIFSKKIKEAIAEADAVVVLWSNRSVSRPWVLSEAAYALAARKLVPVAAPGFDYSLIPVEFAQLHTIAMSDRDAIEAAILEIPARAN